MLTDINDFAFKPHVRSWIEREEPKVFSYWSLDRLYQAVARYLEVPENASVARTLAALNLEPQQHENGFWKLEF